MTVAFAIAVALHEIIAALIPGNVRQSPPREVVSHARVLRIARRHVVPAPKRIVHVAPLRAMQHLVPRRIAAAKSAESRRHVSALTSPPRTVLASSNGHPVWDTGARHSVAGGDGDASGTQGTGTHGDGPGTVGSDEPCGFVEFSDPHGSRFDRSTGGFYVDIRMSVHFADGSEQSLVLDYPWYYPSENANPWSTQNVRDPNFPTRFQAPPAARLDTEPALVQYVAQHSTADGMTLLHDCQGASEQRR